MQKGLSVIRLLQKDVWGDRHDWKEWIIRSARTVRTCSARILTPDAPEYRSSHSAYCELRVTSHDEGAVF